MSEPQSLREKADRCYRLARTIQDQRMATALLAYAADAEKEAAGLEAGLCSRAPFVGQGRLHCDTLEAERPSADLSK
jgi:hypothetical protein